MKRVLVYCAFAVLFVMAGFITSCGGDDGSGDSGPYCGDYIINGSEVCERGNERRCDVFTPGTNGTAYCLSDCSGYDLSDCHAPYCGDEVKDSDEICDGGFKDCSLITAGTKGNASCFADCSGYDASSCREPYCGDKDIDSGELCDGNSVKCETLDASTYGDAWCNDSCDGYNTDNCLDFQEVSVSITDRCDDDLDISVRLFQFASSSATSYDRVSPEDTSKVWVTNGLEKATVIKMKCEKDTLVCYGGNQREGSSSMYWGVGINGIYSCEGCCFSCVDGAEKSGGLICSGDGDAGDTCNTSSDCSGIDVCRNEKCTNPIGLSWKVAVKSVSLNTTKPSGDAWDAFSGKPDIAVVVDKNSSKLFQTAERSDTYSATWSSESAVTIISFGDTLSFCIYDVDVSSDDLVGCFGVSSSNMAAALKQGFITDSGYSNVDDLGVSSFRFTFTLM
ncbi:hypothetical protein KAH37_07400 [bacterium]|nr:hypothetical protein [bacterium]